MVGYKLIRGSGFSDERGHLNFFNAFDMSKIVRFYEIAPSSTKIIRAWQGHQIEKKWFYCHAGSFIMNLMKINNFENVPDGLEPERLVLTADEPMVLQVSGGYATGFKAEKEDSKLMVFSNLSLEASKQDDFRFPVDRWRGRW